MASSSSVPLFPYVFLKSIVPPPSSVPKSSEIVINNNEFKIGRSLQADHAIPYVSISRSHCSLRRDENGTWFIKDTSSFGIKINNQLIGKDKERVLNKDDIVQLDLVGDFKYKFVVEEQTNYKRKHDSDTEESETSQKKIHIDQSQNNNTPDPNEKVDNLIQSTDEVYINSLKEEAEKYKQKLKEIAEEEKRRLEELKKELEENFKNQLDEFKQKLQNSEEEKKHALEVTMDSQMTFTVKEHGVRNGSSSFGNVLESELQCPICSELFISPVTLNCSHTFCEHCISSWRKKKNMCPVCRNKITSQTVNLVVNTIINGLVAEMDERSKQNRQKCIDQRAKPVEKKTSIIDLTSTENLTNEIPMRRSSRRGRRRLIC